MFVEGGSDLAVGDETCEDDVLLVDGEGCEIWVVDVELVFVKMEGRVRNAEIGGSVDDGNGILGWFCDEKRGGDVMWQNGVYVLKGWCFEIVLKLGYRRNGYAKGAFG